MEWMWGLLAYQRSLALSSHALTTRGYILHVFPFVSQFMMLSLVIGVFQDSYSKTHEGSLAKARRKRRVGIMVAYYILDKDGSDVLEPNEFIKFLKETCNTGLTFDIPSTIQMKAHEFVELIEELLPYCNKETALLQRCMKVCTTTSCCSFFLEPRILGGCREKMRGYFSTQIHSYFMLLVSIVNLWVIMIYNNYSIDPVTGANNSDKFDLVLYVLLFFYTFEVVMRVFASGWTRFWWQPNSFYGQMKAKYDFVWTVLVIGMLVVERALRSQGSLFWEPWPSPVDLLHGGVGVQAGATQFTDGGRIILTLNAFRVFSNVAIIRPIFFGLLYIVPSFGVVAGLCLCVIHAYAIVGTLIMGGSFMYLEAPYAAGANFNSVLDSWMTLWQLLVGSSWHLVMYDGIFATNGWVAFYFMSYTAVMTLLITNLVIGIFVNANSKVTEAKERGGDNLTTMDMKSMLTETSGGKKFIFLSHPEGLDDPVAVRKIEHGGTALNHAGGGEGEGTGGKRHGAKSSSTRTLFPGEPEEWRDPELHAAMEGVANDLHAALETRASLRDTLAHVEALAGHLRQAIGEASFTRMTPKQKSNAVEVVL